MSFKVIFQDDYLMVIDKPPGLVVTPAETQKTDTVSDILMRDYGINVDRGGVVHRIDKDTSGLLVIAKNPEILEKLQEQFKERSVKKMYIALVHGKIESSQVIKGAVGRNPRNREKFIVTEEGKEAETEVVPVEFRVMSEELRIKFNSEFNKVQKRKLERSNYGLFTLVHAFPLTGRTHQIRVHLKYIDHPIVGDEKYAGRKTSRLDGRFCKRQFLHAANLSFTHPVSGERLTFESPLPDDLKSALALLETAHESR